MLGRNEKQMSEKNTILSLMKVLDPNTCTDRGLGRSFPGRSKQLHSLWIKMFEQMANAICIGFDNDVGRCTLIGRLSLS
jgi:hypothetical protein